MKVRSEIPTAENTTNMDGFGTCEVGTTLENLKAAIGGETGASATSAAEQIHIGLEYALVAEVEPDFEKPAAPEAEGVQTDLNLIMGAQGEIFETSDMYPAFIKKAQEEGNTKAVQVFTRAKLAEAYHAKLYMDAYTTIDTPFDGKYYLCPICGYIHKGENFEKCPICFCPKASFRAF